MVRRDEFLIGPKEKAAEAIKAGKVEEALKYLDVVSDMFHNLHDRYVNNISQLHALLAEAKGEEWLEELNHMIYDAYQSRFEPWKNMSAEELVETTCNIHRAHYSEFHVNEDDEKYVVVITACNAGGRLLRDGVAKRQNAVTKKAYTWSFNKVRFPYYCVHAYIFNGLWKDLGVKVEVQWGRQYDDHGNKVSEPCKYIIFKR